MARSNQYGASVPTTNVWDPSEIYASDLSPELKEILVRMYQNLNIMSTVLNVKDTGSYNNTFAGANVQQWFPNPANNSTTSGRATERPVYRTVINFGALPNAITKSVAHNIICNGLTTFTRIYGAASDTTGFNYIPIPYASNAAATAQVMLTVDATNVTIDTGTVNRSNFNICYIVLEYIQS